jgi:transcriptional regulator with XRE-family HTH domain
MNLTAQQTDTAVLQELGARLTRRRIGANYTQAELAQEAGVSKRTLERIEAGHSVDFAMLIRVLRVLKLMDALDSLVPALPQSPIALLKSRGRERKRAGHPRRRKAAPPAVREPASPWKWRE